MFVYFLVFLFISISFSTLTQNDYPPCFANEESCGEYPDAFQIMGHDYVEFYVSNAKQAAHYWRSAFGFKLIATRTLGTGEGEESIYVVKQNKITFVLTSPMHSGGIANEYIEKHGDYAARTIALLVLNATEAWEKAVERGATSFMEPTREEDKNGYVIRSGIYAWGDLIHIFVERDNYKGTFLPGFEDYVDQNGYEPEGVGLLYIDHMVPNVGFGERDSVALDYYQKIFGFHPYWSKLAATSSEYSAVDVQGMANNNHRIKYNALQPRVGMKKKSFAQEFVEYYEGQGINHIALESEDIVKTMTELRKRGVDSLKAPDAFYNQKELYERVGEIDEDIETLQKLMVMVDRDEFGYLLQIFLTPMGVRPCTYIEIIQRKGAKTFGDDIVKALVDSLEQAQKERGTYVEIDVTGDEL